MRSSDARLRSLAANCLVLIVAIAVGLALAELAVRRFLPQILTVSWTDRVHGVRAAKPNVAGRFSEPPYFDTWLQFNSQRFRADHDFTPRAAPGVTRIAFLGDSFVFGWGVNAPDAYPSILERLFRERGLQAEVINAGIVGQSMGEKALWYRYAVAAFHPNVVVVQVLMDDVDSDVFSPLFERQADGSLVPRPQPSSAQPSLLHAAIRAIPGYGYLGEHSHLIGLLRSALGVMRAGKSARVLFDPDEGRELSRYRQKFVQQGIPFVCQELLWLDHIIRGDGSRLAVVFTPMRQEIYRDRSPIGEQTIWKSVMLKNAMMKTCERNGIRFLDLTPAIASRAASSPTVLYFPVSDGHPNALGYHALANATAEWLLRTGVVQTLI